MGDVLIAFLLAEHQLLEPNQDPALLYRIVSRLYVAGCRVQYIRLILVIA
jgi:hypothetical protein